MSSKVTIRQSKGAGVVGLLTLIAGIVLVLAGGATWWVVADKLADEDITVAEDASFLAGRQVMDPFTAYAQADVIDRHAREMAEGQTYAQLDREDPRRDAVMNASFLRASLFTSVVSFGIAALVIGLGVLFIIVGWALRRLAGGPPVIVESTDDPAPTGATAARTPDDGSSAKDAPTKDEAARRTVPAPATSATPVVAAAAAAPSATAPTSVPAAPQRTSRAERAASPAPAGVRPDAAPTTVSAPSSSTSAEEPGAGTPDTTTTPPSSSASTSVHGSGSDLPAGPKGDARLEEIDGQRSGWASPADRVPPVDGGARSDGSKQPGGDKPSAEG
ncbi:hypothetical protein [Sanguibacter suaedae]|uniref:hypothetical protein n=1 Tax=Sanguibacter suaedae TaxID=2795737 RepID=UPI0027DD4358|nr:hypothetical protein [Sanguibacter suaedae]